MKHALLVAIIVLCSCQAPEDEFYATVFLCDGDDGARQCGTDRTGKAMICYPGHLLGGSDFCTETCDAKQPPSDPRFACIDAIASSAPGALMRRCHPSGGAASCPTGLACYRTDVLADEGLCVSTSVCSDQSDCPGPGRDCGAKYAKAIGGAALGIKADHLHCVQETCSTTRSACKPDEACLFDYYASGNVLPDICVPKCDHGKCPPNFSCARKEHSPGSPAICVPGVAGTTCARSEDCLLGDCLDTGAGFSVCALPMSCAGADYCGALDQPADKFICAEGIRGQAICVNTRPYGGGSCKDSTECPSGQECHFYNAYADVPMHGDCRAPCNDGRCEARGGVPYVCLGALQEGGCHPTDFGLPCSSDTECFEGLECLAAGPDDRSLHAYSPRLCTARCETDAECNANRLTGKGGFCEPDGICRRRGHRGAPCTRDEQCYSEHCGGAVGCLE